MKTIDLTPTWETAARIYCAVLRNPDADADAVDNAEKEILRVARIADAFANAVRQEGKSSTR